MKSVAENLCYKCMPTYVCSFVNDIARATQAISRHGPMLWVADIMALFYAAMRPGFHDQVDSDLDVRGYKISKV